MSSKIVPILGCVVLMACAERREPAAAPSAVDWQQAGGGSANRAPPPPPLPEAPSREAHAAEPVPPAPSRDPSVHERDSAGAPTGVTPLSRRGPMLSTFASPVVREDKAAAPADQRGRPSPLPAPLDQGASPGDREIAVKIREAIAGGDSGFTAPRLKMVIFHGKVSLCGSVSGKDERALVVAAAKRVAGDDRVVDLLAIEE